MTHINGFAPIAEKSARILILGSMPSETSIREQQYYGHPRNAFWPVMLAILSQIGPADKLDYQQRKELIIRHHIAVWDVLQSCSRKGSLDSAIAMKSIIINDFQNFFSQHDKITKVLFNGAMAENIFKRHVLTTLDSKFSHLQYFKLPSSSPAHASLNLQEKTAIWRKHINNQVPT